LITEQNGDVSSQITVSGVSFTKWATFLEYLQQPTSCSNATQRLETSGLDMPWPIYDPPNYGWSICRLTNETDFENLQTILTFPNNEKKVSYHCNFSYFYNISSHM